MKMQFKKGFPVDKIAEKVVCRNVFLTIWHNILSAQLTKIALFHID